MLFRHQQSLWLDLRRCLYRRVFLYIIRDLPKEDFSGALMELLRAITARLPILFILFLLGHGEPEFRHRLINPLARLPLHNLVCPMARHSILPNENLPGLSREQSLMGIRRTMRPKLWLNICSLRDYRRRS